MKIQLAWCNRCRRFVGLKAGRLVRHRMSRGKRNSKQSIRKAHQHAHRDQSARYNALASAEEKYARAKLNREVNAGRFSKPNRCQRCGQKRKLNAHHFNGYDKANSLTVVWVCVPCHLRLHGRVKANRNLSARRGSPPIDHEDVLFMRRKECLE